MILKPEKRYGICRVEGIFRFKELSEIPLNDICMTAPAITNGMIIFRTQKYLIAAGKK